MITLCMMCVYEGVLWCCMNYGTHVQIKRHLCGVDSPFQSFFGFEFRSGWLSELLFCLAIFWTGFRSSSLENVSLFLYQWKLFKME